MTTTQNKIIAITGGISTLIAAGFLFGGGCGEEGMNFRNDDATQTTALALSTQLDKESSVTGMYYSITPVSCSTGAPLGQDVMEHSGTIEEMTFPAGLVPDHPLDAQSEHRFADYYKVLAAGCYDISATPLIDDQPAQGCATAHASNVQVVDGMTTEVTLISQCDGASRGGLDIAATLNYAPHIDALTYTPSKFVEVCQTTKICATAVDPDKDPLEIVFKKLSGPDQGGAPVYLGSTTSQGGATNATRCIEVDPTTVGTYDYAVEVYDLVHDEDGSMLRYEELYQQMGRPQQSHDSLQFPLHVSASDDPQCGGGGVGTADMSAESDGGGSNGGGNNGGGITEDFGGPLPDMDMGSFTPDAGDPQQDMSASMDMGQDQGGDESACNDLSTAELRQQVNCQIQDGTVTFTIPQGACQEELSFSTYELPSGTIRPFDEQVLYRNVTNTYGPGTHTLTLDLPQQCGFQSDLYVGGELAQLDERCGHCGRIICYDYQQDATCQSQCSGSCEVQSTQDTSKRSHASITVTFECDQIQVTSSKDLSNVVVEYEDGTRQKFDNLAVGQNSTFAGGGEHAGKKIVKAWVKAGSYKSGDGPGYGERFESCQSN